VQISQKYVKKAMIYFGMWNIWNGWMNRYTGMISPLRIHFVNEIYAQKCVYDVQLSNMIVCIDDDIFIKLYKTNVSCA
jgi:hypothetical protein